MRGARAARVDLCLLFVIGRSGGAGVWIYSQELEAIYATDAMTFELVPGLQLLIVVLAGGIAAAELVMDELQGIGDNTAVPRGFRAHLREAALEMGLLTRANRFGIQSK